MGLVFTNNAASSLAAAITNSATQLTILSDHAASFPAMAVGDWCILTIEAMDGTYEIVKATARAANVFTIQRAQEDTTAKAFAIGARVEQRLTAGVLADLLLIATTTTDGRMSAADKTKLAGIAAGATANTGTVTSVGATVPNGFSVGAPVTTNGNIAITYTAGYQGFTAAEAAKLLGIAAGAQVNTVTSVNTKDGAVVINAADVGAVGNISGIAGHQRITQAAYNALVTAGTTVATTLYAIPE